MMFPTSFYQKLFQMVFTNCYSTEHYTMYAVVARFGRSEFFLKMSGAGIG